MTLADWQGELGGLTFGAGTLYELTGPVGARHPGPPHVGRGPWRPPW